VTKTLYYNQADLAAAGKAFNAFFPDEMAPDLGIDMHPGAIRFYKEIGLLK
jgi:TRAP-type uncharacterized transport system substrate-binding protein